MICSGKTFLVGLSPTCWGTDKEFASSVADQKEQQRPHYKVYNLTCSLSCHLSVQSSLGGGDKNHTPKGHKNSLQNRVYPYRSVRHLR